MDKPPIADVIGQYIELRRAGHELKARCPFHEDKTPSFYVNEELGVFYCFGCGEKGDVLDFLQKWSGKTFKEVVDYLGLNGTVSRIVPDDTRIAAAKIKAWMQQFSEQIACRMRHIGQDARIAWISVKDGTGDQGEMQEYLSQLNRKWSILETLHDDLINPDHILELYERREDLERLVSNA